MSKIRTDVGPWSIVPEWVSDHERSGLSHAAVRLYAVLMLYADGRTGEGATPSRATLARRMGLRTTSRVDVAKVELMEAGILEVESRFEGGRQTSNRYRLLLVEPPREGSENSPLPGASKTDPPGASKSDHEPDPQEPEASPEGEAPRPVIGSRIDPVWDALVDAMRTAPPVTRSGRGAWNSAVKELREAGADPSTILAAADNYRRTWPDITLTPTALAKHWHVFALEPEARRARIEAATCDECGIGGGHHLTDCSKAEVAA